MKTIKPVVIKIGGSTLGSHDTTLEDIVTLQKQGKPLVVVHGGGKVITDWQSRHNIVARFIRGERVTDRASLDLVVAVLAGLVNKELVADIIGMGGRAVGLSGVDGVLIGGKIREPEIGYVGTVTKVNTKLLDILLAAGFVPVVAPVGFNLPYIIGYTVNCPSCGHGNSKVIESRPADDSIRHQRECLQCGTLFATFERPQEGSISNTNMLRIPKMLNINADTVAGEIAAAMCAERLIFLTDVAGILDRSGKLLNRLTPGEAEALVTSGVASGGMIPKINSCLRALYNGEIASIIDGRKAHALLSEIEGQSTGTTIRGEILNRKS